MQDSMMFFLVVLSSSVGLLHSKELLREYSVKSKYIYILDLFLSAQYFIESILKQNIPISFILSPTLFVNAFRDLMRRLGIEMCNLNHLWTTSFIFMVEIRAFFSHMGCKIEY